MQAVVYSETTGEIMRSIEVPDAATATLQLLPGEAWLEGTGSWSTHVVRDRKLWPLSKPRQPPTLHHVWNRDSMSWEDVRSLEQARADRWGEIKQNRSSLVESIFSWRKYRFRMQSDFRATLSLYMAAALANEGFAVSLIDVNNAQVVFTSRMILDFGVDYADWVNNMYLESQVYRLKLEKAASKAAINKLV